MRAKYIAFDCETSGLDPDKAELLTVYVRFLSGDLEIIEDLELFCKPEDRYYKVDPEAMNVNKIDLVKHHQKAISYQNAGKILKDSVRSMFDPQELINLLNGKDLSQKLEPIGHYYAFDENFCKRKLFPDWEIYINRKGLDTTIIAQFLKFTGKLPENTSTSLIKLAQFFNIPNQGAHDAKFDTNMTIEVLKCLRKLSLS